VPTKVTGKCGSVTIRLIPAPRGAGIVAARTPKKVLQMAGIEDCYTGGCKQLELQLKRTSSSKACRTAEYRKEGVHLRRSQGSPAAQRLQVLLPNVCVCVCVCVLGVCRQWGLGVCRHTSCQGQRKQVVSPKCVGVRGGVS
jgi:hypothetical protein